jgi:hypothetical protein
LASQAFFERLPFDPFPLTLDHLGSRRTPCIRGHSPPLSDGPMRPRSNRSTRRMRLSRLILRWRAGQRRSRPLRRDTNPKRLVRSSPGCELKVSACYQAELTTL